MVVKNSAKAKWIIELMILVLRLKDNLLTSKHDPSFPAMTVSGVSEIFNIWRSVFFPRKILVVKNPILMEDTRQRVVLLEWVTMRMVWPMVAGYLSKDVQQTQLKTWNHALLAQPYEDFREMTARATAYLLCVTRDFLYTFLLWMPNPDSCAWPCSSFRLGLRESDQREKTFPDFGIW